MKKNGKVTEDDLTSDPRFKKAEFDPRFLPIDSRTSATDPRLSRLGKEIMKPEESKKKNVPLSIPFEEIYHFDEETPKTDEKQDEEEKEDPVNTTKDETSSDNIEIPSPPNETEDEWLETFLTPNEFKFLRKNQEKEEESTFHAYEELKKKHPSYQGITPWDLVEASHVGEKEAAEKTSRIAVTNHDFGVVSLKDLFAIFSGFCPKGGKVIRGFRYYSRFGEQAMRKDLESVPATIDVDEDLFDEDEDEDEEKEDEEEEKEDADDKKTTKDAGRKKKKKEEGEKDLRTIVEERRSVLYEMQKMRYYFSIFEFDSPDTCIKVYDQCNGCDVEDTQQYLDLSLVPRGKSFEDYILVEGPIASENMRDYDRLHKGKNKVFNAPKSLSSVWDVDSSERKRVLDPKNFDRVPESEILKYLNCDDDEDEEGEGDLKNIRKLLLGKRANEVDEEDEGEDEDDEDEDEEEEEEVEVDGMMIPPPPPPAATSDEKTDMRKNEITNKKLEELVYGGHNIENGKEFNIKVDRQRNDQMKRSIEKKKSEEEDEDEEEGKKIDLERFQQLLNNPEFQIDPSHHKFPRAKTYSTVVSKKRSRKRMEEEGLMVDEDGEIKKLETKPKKRKIDHDSKKK